MVDLKELREFATGLPDGADTLVRDAIAELTQLRAKAAAGAKLREALPVVTPRYCRECSADYALEEMNDAAAEYDAAVGEGGG